MGRYTIYVAHPMSGLKGDELFAYYERVIPKLESMNFTVLHPLIGKGYLRHFNSVPSCAMEKILPYALSADKSVYERDRWMVIHSDIMYVDFTDAKDKSIGCCMELAIAREHNVHSVIVLPSPNVHIHAFVLSTASVRYETEDEAFEYLNALSQSIY